MFQFNFVQAVKEFIALVRNLHLHSNGNQKAWNKSTAIKFMMARKFDIFRAVSLYEAHEVLFSNYILKISKI